MDRYTDTVQNEIGNAVPGASVLILNASGNPAVIFSNRAGTAPLVNPILTSKLGSFTFCAADGVYSAQVWIGGVLKGTLPDIRLEDPSNGLSVYAASTGAELIGTAGASNVQADLDALRVDVDALEPYVLPAATNSVRGGVRIGSGLTLTGDLLSAPGYSLPIASGSVLGGVKAGSGVTITSEGVMNVAQSGYTLPPASPSVLGGVKAGSGVTIAGDGTISVAVYSLPAASASTLGGIKIGPGLSIDGAGIVTATGTSSGSVASVNTVLPNGSGNVTLNTDNVAESGTPTNQWFTAARVRAVALTGLSVATNAVIAATDSILAALGKLQAQVSANTTAVALKQDASAKDATGGFAGLTGFALTLKNTAGTITSTIASSATAARAWVFPDKAGTVVLDSTVGEAGLRYFDSGTTNALNYLNGNVQRWAPASGAKALSISNWPASGRFGILQVEGVNLAAGGIPTWPAGTVFVKSDDTEVATFAELGIALKTSGVDRITFWTKNGGTTVYLKVR